MLGPVTPGELGFTQCHEHIMLSKGVSFKCCPSLWMDDIEASIKEVKAFREMGGAALVEAQPPGCNRMSEELKNISLRTGVHIVASTGFHKMQFYPKEHWIRRTDKDRLAEFFAEELTKGMYVGTEHTSPFEAGGSFRQTDAGGKVFKTRTCAGIIKTALDSCGLDGVYKELFLAAAAAQKETGAPMMVHIEQGSSPVELMCFLEDMGVDLSRVYFCHMDRACRNQEVIRQVLKRGISLEFDTIGRFKYHSDEEELKLIKGVLSEYEDQLLLSLDTTRTRLKSYCKDAVGITYILETFLPMMRKEGVSIKQLKKIFLENPAGILAW